jgi:lipopolysaccharide export system permease protein
MKKIDKLVLKAFLGPFLLTFATVVFIFVLQFIINYFDDIIGKGLSVWTYLELLFYCSINIMPVALPLAVLLSSLITFGNLGEHYELTAIKSSGVSLIRVLRPVFIFTLILTLADMWFQDKVVPQANLNFFSMLYDIKTKKATLNLKEGTFYDDLPNYSIKVNKKFPDGKTLKDLIIYDHTKNQGNTDVIMADSGKMYMIYGERYLVMELFNGASYSQQIDNSNPVAERYIRNEFTKTKIVFDLSALDLNETDKNLFRHAKVVKTVNELQHDVDSMKTEVKRMGENIKTGIKSTFYLHQRADTLKKKIIFTDSMLALYDKKKYQAYDKVSMVSRALSQAKSTKDYIVSQRQQQYNIAHESRVFDSELWKKYTQAVACLIMFLIGAPLGAIIKKGGLGVPVLVSIIFFILYYVLTNTGMKWANEGFIHLQVGLWAGNFILFWVGLFFLIRARNDSRLLEADIYLIAWDKFKNKYLKPKPKKAKEEMSVPVS